MKLTDILLNDRGDYCIFCPRPGVHYLIARGNIPLYERFVTEKDEKPLLPFEFLYPFFERVYTFPFIWKTIMPEDEALQKHLQPLLTYEKNVTTTTEDEDQVTVQKMCLVRRDKKDQHYLLDREVQPFDLEVLTEDSGGIKFIFKFVMQIQDMEKVVTRFPAGNFFSYVEDRILFALVNVMQAMKFSELRGLKKKGLRDDLKKITSTLNKIFKKKDYGFKLLEIFTEELIILPASQKRIDEEQNVLIEKLRGKQKRVKAKAEADATKTVRTTEIAMNKKEKEEVGNAEAIVLGNKLQKLLKFRTSDKKNVNQSLKIATENLGKTNGVISLGNSSLLNEDDELMQNIIANEIQTKKQGGAHGN